MNNQDILILRLQNQLLLEKSPFSIAETVSWFGVMQSQDFSGAKWAISQRTNLTNDSISKAFDKGEILRTHLMRPTWHFVSSEDILWLTNLTKDKVKRMMGTYNKILGLDDEIFKKSEKIIGKELKGKFLTRNEISNILKKRGINWQTNGLAHIVSTAELNGLICSGPKKEKQQTYALLSERAANAKNKTREEGIKELTKRYFQSHGPAQIADFNWWSGLSVKEIKEGIEMNSKLLSETVGGKIYYFFDTKIRNPESKIYLLPNYDEYTVAYKDREIIFEGTNKNRMEFRQNSLFNNVVIINGKIEGLWHRTLKTKTAEMEVRIFRNLTSAEKTELLGVSSIYADFLGLEVKTNFK